MKRFITKKKVKVPRYYILFFFTFCVLLLILIFNLLVRVFIGSVSSEKILEVFVHDSYGGLFQSGSDMPYSFLAKDAFGFPFSLPEKVMSENHNMSDFVSAPTIYLYNTFQTSKYQNNYYSSYSVNPVVVQANYIFQEYLKKFGYSSLVEESSVAKILKENNLSYTLSYRGSRILMEKAQRENPSLNYFFDIGISDDKKESTTYSNYARILFIVGTEYDNTENHKLAKLWNQKLEELAPGVSRGISLRGGAGYHGIYNQDFSSHTLLIYVGGKENTIDEVNRSLEVLAKSFHELEESL